jgi:hypothetical protein
VPEQRVARFTGAEACGDRKQGERANRKLRDQAETVRVALVHKLEAKAKQ